MKYISFAYAAEGSSDLHLKSFIENIIISNGADEVAGYEIGSEQWAEIGGRAVEDKIGYMKENYAYVDFYIVHRDSDNVGYKARYKEVFEAARRHEVHQKIVPLITDRMLEAWLMTDKEFLKTIAGNSNYNGNFNGINFSALDSIADPKSVLENLLCSISGCEGAKLKQFKKSFPEMRMRLANELSIDNEYLRKMKSYQEFKANLIAKIGMF